MKATGHGAIVIGPPLSGAKWECESELCGAHGRPPTVKEAIDGAADHVHATGHQAEVWEHAALVSSEALMESLVDAGLIQTVAFPIEAGLAVRVRP